MSVPGAPVRGRKEAKDGKQSKQVMWLLLLLLLLGVLLYLYWLLSKPVMPEKKVSDPGITHLFSIYGWGKERLRDPDGVAFDKAGNIYVADTGRHRIDVFDGSGDFKLSFGSAKVKNKGSRLKKDQMLLPLGVAVADNGDIYVTEQDKSRVSVWSSTGKYKRQIFTDRPNKVYIIGGKLYVTTPTSVQVMTLKGKILRKVGTKGRGPGQFNYPNGLVVDKKGNMFVNDTQNTRMQIFNKKGRVVGVIGAPPKNLNDSTRDFGLPSGLAMDDQNRVYILDTFQHSIRVYTYDGEELGSYGTQGAEDGRFNYPAAIAYAGGDVFAVADKWNDRVQVIRVTPRATPIVADKKK